MRDLILLTNKSVLADVCRREENKPNVMAHKNDRPDEKRGGVVEITRYQTKRGRVKVWVTRRAQTAGEQTFLPSGSGR